MSQCLAYEPSGHSFNGHPIWDRCQNPSERFPVRYCSGHAEVIATCKQIPIMAWPFDWLWVAEMEAA